MKKKVRVEDALNATRAVDGVPGGGVALVRAIKGLDKFSTGDDEEDAGVNIIRRALEPIEKLLKMLVLMDQLC